MWRERCVVSYVSGAGRCILRGDNRAQYLTWGDVLLYPTWLERGAEIYIGGTWKEPGAASYARTRGVAFQVERMRYITHSEKQSDASSMEKAGCYILCGRSGVMYIHYLSDPEPGHTTDGSRRGGAWRRGEAGQGGAGRDTEGSNRP